MTKYTCLQPAKFKLDGGAMYGIIPKPLWNKLSPADEQNRIELSLRLLLIQTEKKNILIDTGIGDLNDSKFNKMFDVRCNNNPLEGLLEKYGVSTNQITDLIISHLHFDHVGGLGRLINDDEIIPLFPKAILHLHKDHYAYAQNPTPRDSGSFQQQVFNPLIDHYRDRNLINWLDGAEGNIFSDGSLKFIISKGHTPFMIHPYNDQFIYLADIVPTSHHLKPSWVMGYDMAPGVSTENKKTILTMSMEKNLTVIFEHDPDFWGAKIGKDKRGNFITTENFEVPEDKEFFEIEL